MNVFRPGLLACFLLGSSVALAQSDERPAEQPTEQATGTERQPAEREPILTRAVGDEDVQPDEVRCTYVELIGSRIPQRICRTEAEWALIAEENQEVAGNTMRNGGRRSHAGTIY